jgi:polyhydroxyalkanoate synthesis repressor PhaR
MTLIKRYPNRKLYNTDKKEYINLDGIADLIRQGEEIHVVDFATGEDLTAQTLSQVLFDQAKQQSGFLPRTVLAGLIQAGGHRLSSVQRAVAQSLGLHQHINDEIRRRFYLLIERGEIDAEQGFHLMEKLVELGEPPVEHPVREQISEEEIMERILEERGLATQYDLQSLLGKIDDLTAKLNEISARESPGNDNNDDR